MDYRILGTLEAYDRDTQLPLGGARQRAVLALLLLHGNETLTRDVIIDQLWGENPPATASSGWSRRAGPHSTRATTRRHWSSFAAPSSSGVEPRCPTSRTSRSPRTRSSASRNCTSA